MTSRSLCFNLMKEDLKRRVWTMALTILSLVFTLLVPTAIRSSAYLDQLAEVMSEYEKMRWARQLETLVGINGMVIAVLVILAVVWAVSGFRYLHNSRQVDFYHSIPVKRGQLFLASYINGIAVTAAVYFAAQVISVLLILRTGIDSPLFQGLWWKIYLLNMVYYVMLYTTTVIAMMMTGNLIVALLGTVVFCGYGPGVIVLIRGYEMLWFHTICDTAGSAMKWMRMLNLSSPFANYMFALENFSQNTLEAGRMAGAVAVTAALAFLAYVLYRLRPSESAGKAMAFKKTQSPIKLLIALPVAVVFGMFFYSLRSTLTWGIFGALCGSVITCCLMEIIYHFDFRKLFANWIQMAACGAVSVLLILAGIYDWYGYDSWLPKATEVKSAAVWLGYEDNWVTYGEPEKETDYRGREQMVWNYGDQREYQYEHMELTDIYSVVELAGKGTRADGEIRKNGLHMWDSWGYDGRWRICVVCFRMNSGKTVFRQYRIPVDDELEGITASIHDSREYKNGTYPILAQSASDTAAVYFQQYDQVEKLNLDAQQQEKLLAVYQKELEELTMAVREKELPVGTIQFRTAAHQEAIDFYRDNEENRYNLDNRCYYPVYPSFTRTLDAIRGAGGTVEDLTEDMVSEVRIQYYTWYEGEDMTENQAAIAKAGYDGTDILYDDEEELRILTKALVYEGYYGMNRYYKADYADNVDVTVFFAKSEGASDKAAVYQSRRCQLDMNRLTEEEIQRFGLMRFEEEK